MKRRRVRSSISMRTVGWMIDRKSTRLNSSHPSISYAAHPTLPSFPTRRSSDLLRKITGRFFPTPFNNFQLGMFWRLTDRRAYPYFTLATNLTVKGASSNEAETSSKQHQHADCRLDDRSEEHTSELQSPVHLVCRPPNPTLFPYTTLFRSVTQNHRQIFPDPFQQLSIGHVLALD